MKEQMNNFKAGQAHDAVVFQVMSLEDVLEAVGIVSVYGCNSVRFIPTENSVKDNLRELGYTVEPCMLYLNTGFMASW